MTSRRKVLYECVSCGTRYGGARVSKCKKKELLENIKKRKERNLAIHIPMPSRNSYGTINLLFVKMRLVRQMSTRVISSRVIVTVVRARTGGKNPPAAITIQLINVSNYSHLILNLS